MPDLAMLAVRKFPKKEVDLPIKLSIEERKRLFRCPKPKGGRMGTKRKAYMGGGFCVSRWTCLQCPHYKIFQSATLRAVSKRSGACVWPKKAPIESRRITRYFTPLGGDQAVDEEELVGQT